MASLRDVLNHIGRSVRIVSRTGAPRQGRAIRRGNDAFFEKQLEPVVGETVEFIDDGAKFGIAHVMPELVMGKVDHYQATLTPVDGDNVPGSRRPPSTP